MSQKDMLKNQVLEEILRERRNYYFSISKVQDFWLLISPKFLKNLPLNKTIFFNQKKENVESSSTDKNFYSVLLSSNKEFIKWIELRLGYFENFFFSVAGSNGQVDGKITVDGISGELNFSENSDLKFLLFSSDKTLLDPEISFESYKKIVDTYSKQKSN